jgi:hypothetical protein
MCLDFRLKHRDENRHFETLEASCFHSGKMEEFPSVSIRCLADGKKTPIEAVFSVLSSLRPKSSSEVWGFGITLAIESK